MKHLILAGLVCCLACGSDSAGSAVAGGKATGLVAGHGLDIQDAIFVLGQDNQVAVLAADHPDICASFFEAATPPTGTTTALALVVFKQVLSGPAGPGVDFLPVTAGVYTFHDATTGSGQFLLGGLGVGSGCVLTAPADLSGGTVTINQVGNTSGTNFKMDFDLSFGSDSLNGNVEARYCAAAATSHNGCSVGNLRETAVPQD